jgi:hypothetical protein
MKKRQRKSTAGTASRVRTKAMLTPAQPFDSRRAGWQWIVDDRMRNYGDIDFNRRVIRINRAMHKREGELLIDTLFHEELHRMFPQLSERAVCLMTKVLLPTLSTRYRNYLYSRIRAR